MVSFSLLQRNFCNAVTPRHFFILLIVFVNILSFLTTTLPKKRASLALQFPVQKDKFFGPGNVVLKDALQLQQIHHNASQIFQVPVPSATMVPSTSHNSTSAKSSAQTSQLNENQAAESHSPPNQSTTANSSCNMPQPPFYPLKQPEDPNLPKLLTDYIDFHRKARECLLNPQCKTKPKILVARCPKKGACLGLGDRMRGVVFSFSLALVTERVYFLHKFSHPYPLKIGLAPASIDWTLPPGDIYNESWPHLEWYWCKKGNRCLGSAPHPSNFSNFDDQGLGINMYRHDIVKLFDGKPFISIASRISLGHLSFLRRNPHLSKTYSELSTMITTGHLNIHRLLFEPSEATRQKLKAVEFKGDHHSVHIRTGIDSRETHLERFQYLSSHPEKTVSDVLECLAMINKGNNISSVFLASDSSRMKELFLNKGKEKGFDVHLIGKKTMHYDKVTIQGSATLDSACSGFLDVFTDLFMLAGGKTMVKTGSNFAAFAGFLGRNQRRITIEPGISSVETICLP